jgi:hypothetical protein
LSAVGELGPVGELAKIIERARSSIR